MVEIRIPYPKGKLKAEWCRLYGLNAYWSGKHWSVRAKDAETWHWIVASAINSSGVKKVLFDKPVKFTYCWNDRMDLTNHAAMRKMIEDSLKGVLIKDDSKKYVAEVVEKFHDEPNIKIIIEEVNPDG